MLDKLLNRSFQAGLLVKFVDSFLEIIGGIIFYFISNETIGTILEFVFRNELIEDPNDVFVNGLINVAHTFSVNVHTFLGLYLVLHGVVKILLVLLLWRKDHGAYPYVGFVIFCMVLYQAYQIFLRHSIVLTFLTVIDIIIVLLIIREYSIANKISS